MGYEGASAMWCMLPKHNNNKLKVEEERVSLLFVHQKRAWSCLAAFCWYDENIGLFEESWWEYIYRPFWIKQKCLFFKYVRMYLFGVKTHVLYNSHFFEESRWEYIGFFFTFFCCKSCLINLLAFSSSVALLFLFGSFLLSSFLLSCSQNSIRTSSI